MKSASLLACRASDCAAESSKGLLALSRTAAMSLWSALLPASRPARLPKCQPQSLPGAAALELTLWKLP